MPPPPPRWSSPLLLLLSPLSSSLLLPLICLLILPTMTHTFELSCANARIPHPSSLDFCGNIVTWKAASVYSHINYTDFRAGPKFTDKDQDRLAQRQYDELVYASSQQKQVLAEAAAAAAAQEQEQETEPTLSSSSPSPSSTPASFPSIEPPTYNNNNNNVDNNLSPACQRSLQRFVCASVFPECPHEGFGVPFIPVCRNLCREAENMCGIPLSCEFFQAKDCTAALDEGFFALKEDQGPYEPLPFLYGILLVIWTGLSFVWLYHTCRKNSYRQYRRQQHRHRHPHTHTDPHTQRQMDEAMAAGASRLCRLLSCVPIAKVCMMLLSLAFWSTCVTWGYCSFWMGVSLINCQLMYETFSLIGFVLIAKGWCITRPGFHAEEWRTIIILMCSFYLASSSLLLVRRLIMSSALFWVCTGVLYGGAYVYVIFNVRERLSGIEREIARLQTHTQTHTQGQRQDRFRLEVMTLKHWMYRTLAVLLTVFCLTELFFCLLPILHHVQITYIPLWVQAGIDTLTELDARLWLTLIIHEVVEIAILFMVGFLFRPRLLSTFFYIEMDRMEVHTHTYTRAPPVYLIPVPAGVYDEARKQQPGGAPHALLVGRKELSEEDVKFTFASSAFVHVGMRVGVNVNVSVNSGGGGGRRRRSHSRSRSQVLAGGGGVVLRVNTHTHTHTTSALRRRRRRSSGVNGRVAVEAAAAVTGAGQVEREEGEGATGGERGGEEQQQQQHVQQREEEEVGEGEVEMEEGEEEEEGQNTHTVEDHITVECVKAVIQFHSSRFLIVRQPDNRMFVAVPEEEEEEE